MVMALGVCLYMGFIYSLLPHIISLVGTMYECLEYKMLENQYLKYIVFGI